MKSRMAWGLALSVVLVAGTAFAQAPRRIDPGVPPAPGEGSWSSWQTIPITGQAPASTLGSMAVRSSDGNLYVWSMHQESRMGLKQPATPMGDPRRIDPSDPPNPGEGGPPGIPNVTQQITVSTLYRWNGDTWLPELVAKDQTAHSVYVGPLGDIYANTNLADGSFRIYHKYGASWTVEPVAAGVIGPAEDFAGNGEVYMRAGNAILRHAGHSWVVAYACDQFRVGDGLFDLGAGQIVAPCEGHEHIFNGTTWMTVQEGLATHVHSLWGGRDINGELHLFAGGADPDNHQARIYQYVETQPGTLVGQFKLVLEDPDVAGKPEFINSVWGAQVHDVYAAGLDNGFGVLYHFNGNGWVNAAAEANLPEMTAVVGNAEGDLWVGLIDGRLLYRPAVAPPVTDEIGGPSPPPIVPGSGVMTRATLPLLTVGTPSSAAILRFSLPDARNVSLTFFDLGGREIDVVSAGRLTAGVHDVTWNAIGIPSGLYFCRLDAGTLRATSKVLVRR